MNLKRLLSEEIKLVLVDNGSLSHEQLIFYFTKHKQAIIAAILKLQDSPLHWTYFTLPQDSGRLRFFKQKENLNISLESPLEKIAQASFHRLVYELHKHQYQESFITDTSEPF